MSKRNPYEAAKPRTSEYTEVAPKAEDIAETVFITEPADPLSEDTVKTVELVAPEGTVKEVLDWVDGDKQKAQVALDAEEASEKPRVSLVKELKETLEED